MRMALIIVLAVFWIFLATRAFQAGDPTRAVIYLAVGGALTVWRLTRK